MTDRRTELAERARNTTLDVEALATAIETGRRVLGITQSELASDLGIGRTTMARLIEGHTPNVPTFCKLLAWLDMPAERFFDRRVLVVLDGKDMSPIATIAAGAALVETGTVLAEVARDMAGDTLEDPDVITT